MPSGPGRPRRATARPPASRPSSTGVPPGHDRALAEAGERRRPGGPRSRARAGRAAPPSARPTVDRQRGAEGGVVGQRRRPSTPSSRRAARSSSTVDQPTPMSVASRRDRSPASGRPPPRSRPGRRAVTRRAAGPATGSPTISKPDVGGRAGWPARCRRRPRGRSSRCRPRPRRRSRPRSPARRGRGRGPTSRSRSTRGSSRPSKVARRATAAGSPVDADEVVHERRVGQRGRGLRLDAGPPLVLDVERVAQDRRDRGHAPPTAAPPRRPASRSRLTDGPCRAPGPAARGVRVEQDHHAAHPHVAEPVRLEAGDEVVGRVVDAGTARYAAAGSAR